jgi:glycerophosphoryl diester phosphodiesterase
MVNVVAHRGFSGKFPENTAVAFKAALALGVEMIELDVHLAEDGSLIVIHDATVDRTSDGTGRVDTLSLDEIKAMDAGSWLDPSFKGEQFLVLGEALDLIGDKVKLNVHVKAYDETRMAVLTQTIDEIGSRDLIDSSFIASDEQSIILVKQILPELAVCSLSTKPKETYIGRSLSYGCEILQPGHAQVDEAFVSEAHEHGLEVNPFYADEEGEMRRLIEAGVDGILTNHPDLLQSVRQ